MLKAGDLRFHAITIQNPLNTKDSNGEDIRDWVTLYENVPAALRPVSVRDLIAAKANQSEIKGRFVIRNRAGLEDNQRVIYRGKAYDIAGWLPDPESGRDYVTAPYSEGVNQGGF